MKAQGAPGPLGVSAHTVGAGLRGTVTFDNAAARVVRCYAIIVRNGMFDGYVSAESQVGPHSQSNANQEEGSSASFVIDTLPLLELARYACVEDHSAGCWDRRFVHWHVKVVPVNHDHAVLSHGANG